MLGWRSPGEAGLAAVGMADLVDDGVLLCAAPVAVVNNPVYSDSEMSDDCVSVCV